MRSLSHLGSFLPSCDPRALFPVNHSCANVTRAQRCATCLPTITSLPGAAQQWPPVMQTPYSRRKNATDRHTDVGGFIRCSSFTLKREKHLKKRKISVRPKFEMEILLIWNKSANHENATFGGENHQYSSHVCPGKRNNTKLVTTRKTTYPTIQIKHGINKFSVCRDNSPPQI